MYNQQKKVARQEITGSHNDRDERKKEQEEEREEELIAMFILASGSSLR